MVFGDTNLQKFVFALKECTKPSYKIETTQHVLINHTFNFPKNLVWNPINIKLVTAREECECWLVSRAVQAHILKAGYLTPNQSQKVQLSKMSMINGLGANGIEIYQVDENGEKLEGWRLKNAMITDVKYGQLSYEQEGFVDTDLAITYDWAEFIYIENPTALRDGDYVNPEHPRTQPPKLKEGVDELDPDSEWQLPFK